MTTSSDASLRAMRAVVHTSWIIERECIAAGLTMAQYRLLDFVRSEPVRAGELAAKAAISKPNLTTIVDGLETRGWVRRYRVEGDRRGVSLELTDSGLAMLHQVEAAFGARVDGILEPAEKATVVESLNTLLDALHQPAPAEV